MSRYPTECMSLAEALELLGPIRAWVSKDKTTGKPAYWLDGKRVKERAIKVAAHEIWAKRQLDK